MMIRAVCVSCLVPLLLALPSQAKKNDPAEDAASYKVSVTNVEVAVGVWDSQGKFIGDLKKEDFEVREEGKPVEVETFDLINLGGTADAAGKKDPERRRFFLFVDLLNSSVPAIRAVKPQLLDFVTKTLRPEDGLLFAALTNQRKMLVLQDFDSPRDRLPGLIEALQGNPALIDVENKKSRELADIFRRKDYAGGNAQTADSSSQQRQSEFARVGALVQQYAGEQFSRGAHGLQALGTFADFADSKDQERGIRVLVYVSEGVPVQPAQDLIDLVNREIDQFNIRSETSSTGALSPRATRLNYDHDLEPLYRLIAGRLNRARMAVYAIDPQDSVEGGASALIADSNRLNSQDKQIRARPGLTELTEPTGGKAFIEQYDLATAFQEIETHTRQRYVLSYKPPKHKKKDKIQFFDIEVRCKRPGVTVSARKGYVD